MGTAAIVLLSLSLSSSTSVTNRSDAIYSPHPDVPFGDAPPETVFPRVSGLGQRQHSPWRALTPGRRSKGSTPPSSMSPPNMWSPRAHTCPGDFLMTSLETLKAKHRFDAAREFWSDGSTVDGPGKKPHRKELKLPKGSGIALKMVNESSPREPKPGNLTRNRRLSYSSKSSQ